jgi:hypothetical protein
MYGEHSPLGPPGYLRFLCFLELAGGEVAIAVVNMGSQNISTGTISLNLLNAGFLTNTRVAVYDVFGGASKGWHTFEFVLREPLPTHGAKLFRLAYSPQYTGLIL